MHEIITNSFEHSIPFGPFKDGNVELPHLKGVQNIYRSETETIETYYVSLV